jgi:hypothetical protein
MGANPWHYFTPYQENVEVALQSLKEQEFRAGNYGFNYQLKQMSSALPFGILSITFDLLRLASNVFKPLPSANKLIKKYGNIAAAMEALLEKAGENGTKSILDIENISSQPRICSACVLSVNELQEIFQTNKPTREVIESILLNESEIEDWNPWQTFWENIGRGEGRYIIAYKNGQPSELFFAGYSFD